MNLNAILTGVAQGVPGGVSTGMAVAAAQKANQERQTQMAMLKLELATKQLKDTNTPDAYKVDLWNKAVAPTMKQIFPDSGDLPPLTEWADPLNKIAAQANGIFKQWRAGTLHPDDARGQLAALETSVTDHLDEAKAMAEPFSKIISDSQTLAARSEAHRGIVASMTPANIIAYRNQLRQQRADARLADIPAIDQALSDVDAELVRRGIKGTPPPQTPAAGGFPAPVEDKATAYLKSIGAKLTPANLKWAQDQGYR